MRKTFTVIFIIVMMIAMFVFEPFSSEPPAPTVTAGNTNIPTVQGSYCWDRIFSSQCVDKAYTSTLDMAKSHRPTTVSPNQKVIIEFSKEPIAGTFTVEQLIDEENSIETKISDDSITVPQEKGIYSYHIRADWKQGGGNYAFSVEVK